ncbi:benzoylformate decarboxylase [Streptomyces sp. HNM0574]|uniref:benzoylformate decarboxylase n=1 Tax=Streptomyces sp. HNM0574 TaxID=2714954 RepID=UPI00146EAB9E|nr:benzoylformate decarboxylase [Streptomyces sp. HNM0574]NLU69386.1 benzoylformate decarboxylase [Streptomyces sp. HNM0574]
MTGGTRPTVRDAVFGLCRSTGMTTVFGNPGSTEAAFFRDWPEEFRYVLGLQESVVVAMAAGHALGTGRAALALLHSAAGVGHAMGAVYDAYRDRVPVVIVSGQQSRELLPLRPFLHADEPEQLPRPYVKWSRQPARAEDVPAALAEAHRVATTRPRGPVLLSVPEDDWDRAAAPVPPRAVDDGFTAGAGSLSRLAERLAECARPALVVGPGVDDERVTDEVVELAERTRAAVWFSPMSCRSGFPEDHPLFQGFLPPVPGQLADRLGGHDLVLALGAPVFRYHVRADGPHLHPGTELFHLDCSAEDAAWLPHGTSVLTALGPAVRALNALVAPATRTAPAPRPLPGSPEGPRPAPESGPATAARLLDLLRERLPRDAVLVEEAPSHKEALHTRLPVTAPGGYLTTGTGALGWGLPLAVGRALASAEEDGSAVRRVVCVVGDGSAMYSVQALWTAARLGAPVTFLLLDNQGYAAVRQLGARAGVARVPGTDVGGIDFAALARSLGCPAAYTDRAEGLADALAAALEPDGGGPALLHVRVQDDERDASAAYPAREG